jgi:hypothetical protein
MRAVARLAQGGPKGELAPADPSAPIVVRRRAARTAAVAGVAVVVLFVLYWRQSRLAPVTSDGASNALQAWDMLHGNLLLHGWQLSDVSFYATELPQYMLIEAVAGLGPWVVHVAAAMTYTLLVVLSALLARGRARGPEGLTRALLAGGIILAPQLGATSTLLTAPDHVGTAVPVLLAWLVIDQNRRGLGLRWRWLVPAAVCVVLTVAMVSDELALMVGIVPLAAACGLRLARNVSTPRWYEAWLAVAAVVAGELGAAAPRVIADLGGYQEAKTPAQTAGLGHLGHAAWVMFQDLLELFGANVISARPGLDFAFSVLRLAGVIMVSLAFVLAAARFFRAQELLVPAFVLAITLNLAAYMISAYGQSPDNVREIAAVMPLGAVLAGRVLAGPVLATRVRAVRLAAVVAIIGAGYALALAYGATQGQAAPANQALATWLDGHGLRDGLATYWQANSTTLDSGGRIMVSFAGINDGRLAPGAWEASEADYDPLRHDAAFVVAGGPQGQPGMQTAAELTFGPPRRIYHADGYTILVWDVNLLRRFGRTLRVRARGFGTPRAARGR